MSDKSNRTSTAVLALRTAVDVTFEAFIYLMFLPKLQVATYDCASIFETELRRGKIPIEHNAPFRGRLSRVYQSVS